MEPKLSDQISISMDGATAILEVYLPPPVNPELFPNGKYQVQMKNSSGNWINLHVIFETTSEQLPDPRNSSIESMSSLLTKSSSSISLSSCSGKRRKKLTVALPVNHPVGDTDFRVESQIDDLHLISNVVTVNLPPIGEYYNLLASLLATLYVYITQINILYGTHTQHNQKSLEKP